MKNIDSLRLWGACLLITCTSTFSTLEAATVPRVDQNDALLRWEAGGQEAPPFTTFFTIPVDWNATAGGRAAAALRDNSATELVQIGYTFDANGRPGGTAPYVVSLNLMIAGDITLNNFTRLYAERITSSQFAADVRLASDGSLKWLNSNANSLVSDVTGEVYILPRNTWLTLTLHRISDTQYRLWVEEPTQTHGLGLLTVAGGLPDVPSFQIGTGLAAATTSGVYLSSVAIGAEAIPEPGSVALLGVALGGGWLLRRKGAR